MVQQIAAAIEEMSAASGEISKDIETISGVWRETS
jgi:methyl-accepting chemotaxis protein